MTTVIREAIFPQLLSAARVAATYAARHEDVAVISLGADVELFVGMDYWLDAYSAERFERAAAAKALQHGSRTAVMVLPLVTTTEESGVNFRPLGSGEVEEGETPLLWFFVFSVDSGFDLARSVLHWDDNDTPYFDGLEVLEGAAQLIPNSPGFALMQGLLALPMKETE